MKWFAAFLLCCPAAASAQLVDVNSVFDRVDVRLANRVAELQTYPELRFPTYREPTDGLWQLDSGSISWTSGFFAGSLWQAHARNNDPQFETWARTWTHGLIGLGPGDPVPDPLTQNLLPNDHDVGFVYQVSFGEQFKQTGDAGAMRVIQKAAAELNSRFVVGPNVIDSWDFGPWTLPVIADSMMSTQTLYLAAANGGPVIYVQHATSHMTNAAELIRGDGSTFHVVDFGVTPHAGSTFQGFADDSTWARGQAWAIHGLIESFKATGQIGFLANARTTADFFLANLPSDGLPWWDFDAPPARQFKDTSAAAVAAAGLIALSEAEPTPADQRRYFQAAERLLEQLVSADNFAADATGETRTLLHSALAVPQSLGLDAAWVVGEYYLLQALERYDAAYPGPGILPGDANRDGTVDVTDLGLLAANFRDTGRLWQDGDFNLDGMVDVSDLGLLAGNFRSTSVSFADEARSFGLPVPEPVWIGVVPFCALLMRRVSL